MYEHLILEKLTAKDVDLDSFEIKPRLNPKIWANESKIHPEIRKQLMKIAKDFYDSLDTPWVDILDIRFTGSLANYNWSKFSDLDLHVVIDYKEINKDIDLVTEYLKLKVDAWNDTHDLNVNGFAIELYAQDFKQSHISTGVYSLVDSKWLDKPKKTKPKYDKEAVKEKAAEYINDIEELEDLFDDEEYDKVLKNQKKLKDKIKAMRKVGLDGTGEYSIENIVFKVLRRGGYLERLNDLKIKSYDLLNSIKVTE